MPSVVAQPPPLERPARRVSGGKGAVQPNPVFTPSVIECMGRSSTCAFSQANGDILLGVDVGPAQRWSEPFQSFRGYAAGMGSNGVANQYYDKKTASFQEGPAYGIALNGSNGNGALYRRTNGATKWDQITTAFYGFTDDGASADPRRSNHKLIVIDGTNVFVACTRDTAPILGIARSLDSGGTFSAWNFGTSRNFTSLVKSPNFAAIYGTADHRGAASTDGVFVLSGLTGTVVQTRIDNVGVGSPGAMVDVRSVAVVSEAGADTIFVVVGNQAGSDANRGIWRARITGDPSAGGFTPSTAVTWTHVFTPGASDRVNAVEAFKPNGAAAGPIYLAYNTFATSTVSSGTYNITADAGGGANNYLATHGRSLNADAATPTFTLMSGAANINLVTYGTRFQHVMFYSGEVSVEKGGLGRSGHQSNDLALSADGLTLISASKTTPWICRSVGGAGGPWDTTPVWQPLSKGLGGLEAGADNAFIPGIGDFAIIDDDRGLFTFNRTGELSPAWCIADDTDGFPGTTNTCNSVAVGVTPNNYLVSRDSDGKGYRVNSPSDYATANATAVNSVAGPGAAIGCYEWVDSTATTRILIVTKNAIYRGTTQVATISTTIARTTFITSGPNCWLLIPDLGIYRSTNDGVTWALWWDKAIPNGITNRFCGQIAQDRDTPTTLWVTFDDGGVWQCVNAHTAGAGSGTGGSRPSGTNKVSGGSLAATDVVSALCVDPIRGDVWATRIIVTGGITTMHVLRHENQAAWVDVTTTDFSEFAVIPIVMTCYDGFMLIGTANGTMRRVA